MNKPGINIDYLDVDHHIPRGIRITNRSPSLAYNPLPSTLYCQTLEPRKHPPPHDDHNLMVESWIMDHPSPMHDREKPPPTNWSRHPQPSTKQRGTPGKISPPPEVSIPPLVRRPCAGSQTHTHPRGGIPGKIWAKNRSSRQPHMPGGRQYVSCNWSGAHALGVAKEHSPTARFPL